ncbi:MAG: glutamate synthase large subunit [Bacteroidetes bacterium]|nr:glutamate synthase large subunit [Bacteroidota bacterium]
MSRGRGLYHPSFEKDSCGIGFIAHLKGVASHGIVKDAITMLENMEHRGACGCEENTGDGAGILIGIPDEYYRKECKSLNIKLPEAGRYGTGIVFFPKEESLRKACKDILNDTASKLNLTILGYRDVPTCSSTDHANIGASALAVEPKSEQIFITPNYEWKKQWDLERKLYVFRNFTSHMIHINVKGTDDSFYYNSLSSKTIVYKGQLTTWQVRPYFPDLQNEEVKSALALVHSRFSTNTFPKWKLAQPFRYMAHNGEINTIRGNVNWMHSRESYLSSDFFTDEELKMLLPICDHERSDSANLDNVVELLVLGGRNIAHVMMMLIPEAWQDNHQMPAYKKAFYEYHDGIIEPWDGPASICFTDGKIVGATLDRNGLRPSRYCLTDDDRVIMASEAGALPVDQSKVVRKGRLQPGRMFVADLNKGMIISDEELKRDICAEFPYQEWLKSNKISFGQLPKSPKPEYRTSAESLFRKHLAFGFTTEDIDVIITPMATNSKEPLGSMGTDIPMAILSDQSQHLSHYFKQLFAQVTNPPIDPIRERLVMSTFTSLGGADSLLETVPDHSKKIHIRQPILTDSDMDKLRHVHHEDYKIEKIYCHFPANGKHGSLERAIDKICKQAESAVANGYNIIVLSDKYLDKDHAPIPSLLITGAVHHHLIKIKSRIDCSLVVEAGDISETHHYATLIGYGASAITPYVTFQTLYHLNKDKLKPLGYTDEELVNRYISAASKGLLKIFSKMGISTYSSYHGSQIFEIVGVNEHVVDKCFKGTASRLGGLGFDEIAKETLIRHKLAYPDLPLQNRRLGVGGVYQWKRRGETHMFNPETIHLLQKSTKQNSYKTYKQYAGKINDQTRKAITIRSLLDFNLENANPVPLEEVEPVENIFKRFATGAMSFGSISHEAHSTLAIAMNRIGGKSNSGEGGEDEIRFDRKSNGDWERSAIKQVASGRFGVTSNYLANAEELQIKMAQGAKPGEGGQLPGHKVDDWIGRVRHSTPGVGLISPPPHHDIYSIEDLAQLIYDLKNSNRDARINVKLVSEAGVGTVAAGVTKAKADVVLISGYDGGTGASPLSSIRHAGLPWELGVAETHQTLVKNKLRSRIVVQTDGQIRTGRDIAIATLLGAEEWGVATAALVVEGCIMMRKCHMNTCPVGIATQNKELRKRYAGDPEHVINFFTFLAEDLREIMAELGFRTINEMVGQVQLLKQKDNVDHWKYKNLDLSPILYKEESGAEAGLYKCEDQDNGLSDVLDIKMLEIAQPALESKQVVEGQFDVVNTDRSIGTILSHEISKKYKGDGLPEDTINFKFRGSAGQSFGAFLACGVSLELEGEANDYFGKGLSGGKLMIYPDSSANFKAEDNIIIGNVAFYGATSGEAYINGLAGERFCVRNSGVTTVVEGIGDHGCEYMTGGRAVILGETGRNFAAGMSGGIAYVLDKEGNFEQNLNPEMVDLDPVETKDIEFLQKMINNHYQYTKSVVARAILDNWQEAEGQFVKVMPRDYKRVLQQKKELQTVKVALDKSFTSK